MTSTPAQSDEGLREAVLDAVEKVYDETHNLGQAADEIMALIAAEKARIFDAVEQALPDDISAGSIELGITANYRHSDNADTQRGWNDCLEAVRAEIKRLREQS